MSPERPQQLTPQEEAANCPQTSSYRCTGAWHCRRTEGPPEAESNLQRSEEALSQRPARTPNTSIKSSSITRPIDKSPHGGGEACTSSSPREQSATLHQDPSGCTERTRKLKSRPREPAKHRIAKVAQGLRRTLKHKGCIGSGELARQVFSSHPLLRHRELVKAVLKTGAGHQKHLILLQNQPAQCVKQAALAKLCTQRPGKSSSSLAGRASSTRRSRSPSFATANRPAGQSARSCGTQERGSRRPERARARSKSNFC